MFCVTGANRHDSVVFEELAAVVASLAGRVDGPRSCMRTGATTTRAAVTTSNAKASVRVRLATETSWRSSHSQA